MEQSAPDFASIKQINPYGVEYWSTRDLMPLLGYNKWERFEGTIKRAMTACEQTGNRIEDHFPASGKMIKTEKGAERETTEILDHMGREELAANYFRITPTESKLEREQIQGEDKAVQTHFGVEHEIRKTIETLKAPLPEDLPPAPSPSIRKMVEERQRAAKKRKLKAAEQEKSGQDTLF